MQNPSISSAPPPTLPHCHSLEAYALPPSTFLATRPHIRRILSSSVLFHPSPPPASPPLALILRRSPTDYWPLRWETLGGSLDPGSDASVLAAAERELREETGLRAKRAVRCVALKGQEAEEVEGYVLEDGGEVCTFPEPGAGWSWAKITFLMEVEEGEVMLQDEEHVDYRWVTEEEVARRRFAGVKGEDIDFVSDMVRLTVLEAFRIKKEILSAARRSRRRQ